MEVALTPQLLQHVLSCYAQPTPLAVAASHPICRIACESRGVHSPWQAVPVEELESRHVADRKCSTTASQDTVDRRSYISSVSLLSPLMKAETYRQLADTHAGLRIGHSLSFIVPSADGRGSSAGHTSDGSQRIGQWQLQLLEGSTTAGKTDANAEGDGRGKCQPDGSLTVLPATAANGIVRVVVLFGKQRTDRALLAATTDDSSESGSESESGAGWSSGDDSTQPARGRGGWDGEYSAVPSPPSPLPHEDGLNGNEEAPPPSPPSKKRARQPEWQGDAVRPAPSAAGDRALASITRSPTSASDDEEDGVEHLFDNWELEAAAADAAEAGLAREKGGLPQEGRVVAGVGLAVTQKSSVLLTAIRAAAKLTPDPAAGKQPPPPIPLLFRASRATSLPPPAPAPAVAPRRDRAGAEEEAVVAAPVDTPPPSAWWLNRGVAAGGRRRKAKPQSAATAACCPPALLPAGTLAGTTGTCGGREAEALQRVSLCVHAQYAYPRWLDWLAAEVSPEVLLCLSLHSCTLATRKLRPFQDTGAAALELPTQRQDEERRARTMPLYPSAPRCPKRYRLPLRAFYQEAASPAIVTRVLRVIAADGCLEHLELPYFSATRLVGEKGGATTAALGRLLRSLRYLDVRQSGVSDDGLSQVIGAIALAAAKQAKAGGVHRPSTDLVELHLGGCGAISQLGVCAMTPLLRRLDVQRTGVNDASLAALLLPPPSPPWHASGPAGQEKGAPGEEVERTRSPNEGDGAPSHGVVVVDALEELELCRCNVDEGLAVLPVCFPNLRSLNLRNSTVSDSGLAALVSKARMEPLGGGWGRSRAGFRLEKVQLEGCSRLQSLAPLWSLPTLRVVLAPNCPVLSDIGSDAARPGTTSPAPASEPRTNGLTELRLQGCRLLRGASLGAMAGRLGRWTLTSLTLDDTFVTDEALRMLCGLSAGGDPATISAGGPAPCDGLEYLSLKSCGNLRSLDPLGALPSLRVLDAGGSSVVDSGLLGLARSTSLRYVDLTRTSVTNISPLAYVPSLRVLQLRFMPRLTDDSLLRFVFAPVAASFPVGLDAKPATTTTTTAIPDLSGDEEEEGDGSLPGDGKAAVVSRVETMDLIGCAGIRLVGCLAHLPSLTSLLLDATNVFDVSFYAFFASKAALLSWRPRGEEGGVRWRLPNPQGVETGLLDRRQHRLDEEAEGGGNTAGALAATVERIPDLEQLRHSLFYTPQALVPSSRGTDRLGEVSLAGCTGVRSIEPLGLLPWLRHLCVEATAVDSTALKGFVYFHLATTLSRSAQRPWEAGTMGLTSLSVARCKYVEEVGCLAVLPTLRSLDAGGSSVDDDALAFLVGGRHVYLDEFLLTICPSRSTANQPTHEPHLEQREAWARALRGRLQATSALQTLRLSGCPHLCSVSPLLGLPALRELWILALPHTMDEDIIAELRNKGVRVHL